MDSPQTERNEQSNTDTMVAGHGPNGGLALVLVLLSISHGEIGAFIQYK
jgi:hypothetical protein